MDDHVELETHGNKGGERQKIPPEKLMTVFARTPFGMFLVSALMIHLVLIGITSLGYLRDMIDPEEAHRKLEEAAKKKAEAHEKEVKEEEAKEEAAEKAKEEAKKAKKTPEDGASGEVEKKDETSADTLPGDESGDGEKKPDGEAPVDPRLEANKDNPVVKKTTEAADIKDVPAEPELNLPLDGSDP